METMGQKFRAAREKKNMSVSKAAAMTHIMMKNVEMMENDDYSKMPAPTYAKGFIRIYATFLGLDPAPLIKEYVDRHLNAAEEVARTPARAKPPTPAPRQNDEIAESEFTPTRERTPWTPPWKKLAIGAAIRKAGAAILPQLPRLIIAAIAVFLLVGVVRCTVNMTSGTSSSKNSPSLMDHTAIMKEPPVRYLDLPTSEEPTP